ncbi:MAG: alpha/beta hydrolase [Bacteriovoracaceae bacterium]
MKVLIYSILLSFFSLDAFAIIIPDKYRSGVEICKDHRGKNKELGFRVNVPIDYKDASKGKTSLYAWTHKPFNPRLNTVVFLSGGPGDTAHGSYLDLHDWNVVFFDQRGNSCSRPNSKETYLDPHFYSSENTARDIEEIRKHLKLNKISVYGVSYGTVPAHLYGHYFPRSTRAVVLEGTIFRGGDSLMRPEHTRKIIQDFFYSLPLKMQQQILAYSEHPQVKSNWYSNVAQKMFYLDDAASRFKVFLNNVLDNEDVTVTILKSYEDKEPTDQEFGFGHVMMGMIGCQELGMNSSESSFYSVFENGQLVSDNINLQQKNYCESLGFIADEEMNLYQASQKPSRAPTTYFQGSHDPATVLPEALLHFNQAITGFGQFIQIDKAGHLPIYGTVASGYDTGVPVDTRLAVLRKALSGREINSLELSNVEKSSGFKWNKKLKR